jgi:PII-like signaling protein
MNLPEEGQLLRIFIGESDRYEGSPLYEWIVRQARQQGLAGATVLRGIAGFGAASRIHTANILRLSLDLPIVVEIVDKPERIEAFLPIVDAVVKEGLVTTEKAHIKLYRAGKEKE